jgi:S1-C subfamily serine protease
MPEYPSPEKFPSLKDRYTNALKYEGNVVPSCIHCHQIGDARRDEYRKKGAIPENVLFPYPHPKVLGLVLDPKERATVTWVGEGSIAEKCGFKPGDAIATLAGQPLLSMADVQWVLHRVPAEGANVVAEVVRGGKTTSLTLALPKDWRHLDDISWRVSTWGLRRMVTGGMVLEDAPDGSPAKLRVKFVGQNGPHAAAKNARVKQGDFVRTFDGKQFGRETDLLAHALTHRKTGDKVKVVLIRDGMDVEVTIPMQD